MMANISPEVEIGDHLDGLEQEIQGTTDCDKLKALIMSNERLLNILHLNIRSIHKNFNDLVIFLEAHNFKFCDIIILTETWYIENINLYNIENFNVHYNNANFNKNDGTVIYVNKALKASVMNFSFDKSKVNFCKINFNIHEVSYEILCGYRPPSSNTQLFFDDLEDYFSNKTRKQIELLIGDMNINISSKESMEANQYVSLLNFYGFCSAINGPTRVTSTSSSCLDHVFVKNSFRSSSFEQSTFILENDISDHYPVMINFSCKNNKNKNKQVSKIISTFNPEIFENLIKGEGWKEVLEANNSEIAVQYFTKKIDLYMNKATKQKTIFYREQKKIKPWITTGLISAIKKRDKLKKMLLHSNTLENRNNYLNYRNNLNKIINKQKFDYYKKEIYTHQNDFKKIYRIISDAVNENKDHSENLEIKNDNNDLFPNKKDMANYCNAFFINVGKKMADKIKRPKIITQIKSKYPSSMFLKPVNKNEIIKHINSLKNNCSPGYDGIQTKIIKQFYTYMINPLVHIINLIFKNGIVPESFKTSVVTPIFKTGDKNKINNYRPISVITNFAKIFEKCLKERLTNFLSMNNILSKNQFGFRSGISTSDAILKVTKTITKHLDKGRKCLAAFLDLAKAFDTVPLDFLLDVLDIYGVRGIVLNVFESYLIGRKQKTKVNNTFSDSSEVLMGIPQGTVLGPLLFSIYINSLTDILLDNGLVVSYADDTVVIFLGESWEEVYEKTVLGLSKIKNWLDSFKLTLNVDKTNYIAFSLTSANRPNFNTIKINGFDKEIKEVEFIKYLGVIIDQHLKWKHHITRLTNNLRKLIRKFYMIREILNEHLLICVYKALVESLLRYAIIVWGSVYENALKPLKTIQNYILKIIFRRNKMFPTCQLYNEKILAARSLFVLGVCSYVFENPTTTQHVNHLHCTRFNFERNFQIPNSSTSLNLRSIDYLGPKIFNILPVTVRVTVSRRVFHRECVKFIATNFERFANLF